MIPLIIHAGLQQSFFWLPLALAGGQIAASAIAGNKARKDAERGAAKRPVMQENPYVRQQLGLAQTTLQGRMAGATEAERNIQQQQATTQANINRAATDPNAVIAGAGAIQSQTNKALENLGLMESQDYERRQANYQNALQNMGEEQRRLFDFNQVGKWETDMAVQGVRSQNRTNLMNTIGQGVMSGLTGGIQGSQAGLSGFGFGKGTPTTPVTQPTAPVSSTYPSIAKPVDYGLVTKTGQNQQGILGKNWWENTEPQVPQQYNPNFFPTSNPMYNMYNNMSNMFPASYGFKR